MSRPVEKIDAERDDDGHLIEDAWVCLCGNRPDLAGFFPCNRAGGEVEPTAADWPEPLYRCDECGRIILQGESERTTRWVVGQVGA